MAENTPIEQQDDPETPLNLHKLYQVHRDCGYPRDATLFALELRCIASSLRGIQSLNAIAIASLNGDAVLVSEWMKGGMCDAIAELSQRALQTLEAAASRAAAREVSR